AKDVHQHVGTAVGVDMIQGEQVGAEAPGPPTVPVVFVSGLIGVDDRFVGQQQQQFLVRPFQGVTDLANDLAQLAARDGHFDDVAEEDADGGEGGVAGPFHEGNQGGQLGTSETALVDVRGQGGLVASLTTVAPVLGAGVLLDGQGRAADVNLLHDPGEVGVR